MDESWLTDTIGSTRQAGADRARIEFVPAQKHLPKDLPETLASFANNTGGWVVCGIDPAQGYIPVQGFSPRKAKKELRRACKQLKPVLRPRTSVVAFEGTRVLVVRIDELRQREKPCHLAKRGAREGSFVRTDEGTVPMAAFDADLLRDGQDQPTHDDSPAKKSVPADLNADLVAAFVEHERTAHHKLFKGKSDKKLLRELHVTRKNKGVTRPTIAGLVALGSFPQRDLPRLGIMFTAFPGTTREQRCADGSKFLDARTIAGPAPAMLDEALAAVRANAPDLPLSAVREAVANAIMHRDYSAASRGYPIQLNLFSDRLEVVSPGGLFGKATVATLGHSRLNSTRNQFLCSILEAVTCDDGRPVAENRGSGFVSMRGQMKEAGLPEPRVQNTPESFTLVLPRSSQMTNASGGAAAPATPGGGAPASAAAAAQPAPATSESPAVQRPTARPSASASHPPRNGSGAKKRDIDGEIVTFLSTRETASLKELREHLGLGRTAVTNHVNALIKQGRVLATEPDRSPKQRYRLA